MSDGCKCCTPCCNCNRNLTEALVLRALLEDGGSIIESIRILVPVDRMKQKCLCWGLTALPNPLARFEGLLCDAWKKKEESEKKGTYGKNGRNKKTPPPFPLINFLLQP